MESEMMNQRWVSAVFDRVRPGWVGACAAAGLAARLALIAVGRGSPHFYDEGDYHALAASLLDGHGLAIDAVPTAFRAPGQPLFLAAVYAVLGRRPIAAEIVQALLLVPLPFIALRLTRLISRRGGGTAARGAASARPAHLLFAAFVALHPGLAYASASLYPVSVTAVTLATGVWLVIDAIESGDCVRGAAAGAMLGIAGACVTYLAPLPAIVAVIALVRRRFAVAVVVAAVGLAPAVAWTARNAAVLGTAQLSTNGGYNLALGANDRATPRSGNWIEPDVRADALPAGEAERDRAYRATAVAWIREHSVRYASLAVGRALASLDSVGRPRTGGLHTTWVAALSGWLLAPVVALGLAGLIHHRRDVSAWVVGAALALIMASSAVTIAKPRFRFPCDPVLCAFAAAAADRLLAHRRSRLRLAPQA
jgi:hypothetical protein